jgi:hypothetical protein
VAHRVRKGSAGASLRHAAASGHLFNECFVIIAVLLFIVQKPTPNTGITDDLAFHSLVKISQMTVRDTVRHASLVSGRLCPPFTCRKELSNYHIFNSFTSDMSRGFVAGAAKMCLQLCKFATCQPRTGIKTARLISLLRRTTLL